MCCHDLTRVYREGQKKMKCFGSFTLVRTEVALGAYNKFVSDEGGDGLQVTC